MSTSNPIYIKEQIPNHNIYIFFSSMKDLNTTARIAFVMSPPKLSFANQKHAHHHTPPNVLLQGLLL